jgi:hypothetical protein
MHRAALATQPICEPPLARKLGLLDYLRPSALGFHLGPTDEQDRSKAKPHTSGHSF